MNFGIAIQLLREGYMVRRPHWTKGVFIFRQISAIIDKAIVPNMQSLPQRVKDEFQRRFNDPDQQISGIYYDNQFAVVNESNLICSYSPSVEDALAYDWEKYPIGSAAITEAEEYPLGTKPNP